MQSAAFVSPTKKRVLEQEAARRVILQKHLGGATLRVPGADTVEKKGSHTTPGTLPQSNNLAAASHSPLPLRSDLQRRMEVVLAVLRMKPKTKLDLVLKYTHADHYELFPDAVVLWEQATHYIKKREAALDALRNFELVASDPRRHFRSLSTHRLVEQKERDALFYQLNYASDLCREALDELEKRCGDQVYVENRLYREKMKKDYTELLFEVEQERLRMIYNGIRPTARPEGGVTNQMETQAKVCSDVQSANPSAVIIDGRTSTPQQRHQLKTPRESIYTPLSSVEPDSEREATEQQAEQVNIVGKASRHQLAEKVIQYRKASLTPTSPGPFTQQANHDAQFRSARKTNLPSATQSVPQESSLKTALERILFRK
ncbi:hypothetical protein PINS_up016722 [Pythium insidiosum]|nr:hypothetical protein PINS_up016722 [Pythium insidiosum]